jgi:16S rRNA (adenine1518-N6/adenine1519-N6)-dimethyltransferase
MSPPGDDAPESSRRYPPTRKSLGQHFLTDPRILTRIADALELSGTETVIEIGPGRGSLTAILAPRARRLILIEYDRALAARLSEKYASSPAVEVVQADVLTVDLGAVAAGAYSLVGNVPYYITTPILFHALERPRARRAVFLVQREVAERIVAAPGTDNYGALSANVQSVVTGELMFRVAPGAFQPPPKVESAVVRIEPRSDPVVSEAEEPAYRAFVQAAFGMRRKQLRRVVREVAQLSVEEAELALRAADINAEARPETLSALDFARLARACGRLAG